MSICYFITSHGLGHCVRSLTIINRLPPEIPVTICTDASQTFLEQELKRPAQIRSCSFDCGTIQPDGFTVDAQTTAQTYAQIHRRNQTILAEEVAFARSNGVRVIATDVASFPLRIANELQIPGVVIGNFTWACIYEEHLAAMNGYGWLLQEMKREYGLASHCLKMAFSTPMESAPNHESVGLVCRRGKNARSDLAEIYPLDPAKRWVLLYVGQWPTEFNWQALQAIAGTQFLVLGNTAPEDAPVVRIDPKRVAGQDVAASCDAVVAKPGYGIASDCVAAGTPLLYTHREGFAEFPALDAGLQQWGKAIRLLPEVFFSGQLAEPLEEAYRLEEAAPFDLDGAHRVGQRLVELWNA